MDNIDKIIDEVLEELETGVVRTEVNYRMKIHSKLSSDFDLAPTLNIKNKELFYKRIKEYVALFENTYPYAENREEAIKRTIANLFVDMSLSDFSTPESYVKRRIDFKNTPLLEDKPLSYIPSLESFIKIIIKPYIYETPFCFSATLIAEEDYLLPTISYGISDGICYIYAIQDYNKHQKTPEHNKINRRLYKLNHQVFEQETEEYKEYRSGKEYYPENISDISPGALLALTLFLKEIEEHGIEKVQIVPYLPVRYDNKIRVFAFKT